MRRKANGPERTYQHIGEPILAFGVDIAARQAAENGSRALLKALRAYYEKHHWGKAA